MDNAVFAFCELCVPTGRRERGPQIELLNGIIEWVTLAAFLLLGIVTFLAWRRRRDETTRWVSLTFGILAFIAVVGRVLPEDPEGAVMHWLVATLLGVLLLFPYFLYRTAQSLRGTSTVMDKIALGMTAAVVVASFAVPDLPGPGEPQPTWFRVYLFSILTQWTVLSVAVALEFWRAGRNQSTIVRTRMRLWALAAVTLSLVLIISGTGGEEADENQTLMLVTGLLTLGSALAFYFSFEPPGWLRHQWRRRDQEKLIEATIDIMNASTRDEVISTFLPKAADFMAAQGIVLRDPQGNVLAEHGMADVAEPIDDRSIVRADFAFGSLLLRTSGYTPFFGSDEIALLGSMGVIANLALERIEAGELRLEVETASLRRRQALEINDNVVQGLAVAKYAFELGNMEKAQAAIEGTLAASRKIITELVEELGVDEVFEGGAPVRSEAATGYSGDPSGRMSG